MMVLPKMPIAMGLMMGLMLPWMMHMETGNAGLAFVLAHILVAVGAAALALLIPAVRARMKAMMHHRPTLRHAPLMVAGIAIGWSATCAICLVIGGQHWT